MRLTFDPDYLRRYIASARDALLTAHGIDRDLERAAVLSKIDCTVPAWLQMLRHFSATRSDSESLRELKADLAEFREWANEARMALKLLDYTKQLER